MNERHISSTHVRLPRIINSTIHPDAVAIGEQQDGWPSGDTQSHCGLQFAVELPQ
ncbi:MAG: hypothetical protein WC919_02730 [Candidatus Paceibacterota bacterium]